MFRSRRILPLAILLGCAGCSPAQYLEQPASVEETRDTVRALKAQQDDLVKRIADLQKELEVLGGRQAETNANLNAELAALAEAMEGLNDRLNDISGQLQRRTPREAPPPDPLAVPPGAPGAPPVPGIENPALSETPTVPEGGAAPETPPSDPALNPEDVYDAAYRDVSRGSYNLAVSGFTEFLRLFPDHSLADNAQYWIGECWYVQNEPARARDEFRKVLDRYPDGDKVPAAYLKLGYSALKLNNTNEARRYLDELVQKYPRSEEARTARQKLASMP